MPGKLFNALRFRVTPMRFSRQALSNGKEPLRKTAAPNHGYGQSTAFCNMHKAVFYTQIFARWKLRDRVKDFSQTGSHTLG